MGNCVFGGLGYPNNYNNNEEGIIRVITTKGAIMEFYTTITAGTITHELPGHLIFPSHDLFWKPLSVHEDLQLGHTYYLLPQDNPTLGDLTVREGHVRSKSIPSNIPGTHNKNSYLKPNNYRMSCDYNQLDLLKRSYTNLSSKRSGNSGYESGNSNYNGSGDSGFWKVRLVICPQQLLEILSQDGATKELIENVRAVAKCGGGGCSTTTATSSSSADEWSLSSSSRNANSYNKDGCLLLDLN